ncbi:TPA: hypothetical protein ACPZLH_000667 [Yersinia enterocolitica]
MPNRKIDISDFTSFLLRVRPGEYKHISSVDNNEVDMTKLKGRSPALARIYDNSNKLDSQLTIISHLLSTGDVETEDLIRATNIAWDINHRVSNDITEAIDGNSAEQLNHLQTSPSVEKEDIKADFGEIDSMLAGMQYLTASGFSSGDLENLIGVTRTLISSLEKKTLPLLAD